MRLKAVSILLTEAKKWQNSLSRGFAVDGKIDTTSLKYGCSCIICPNAENFCLNNGQFQNVGDATASAASPCCTLMVGSVKLLQLSFVIFVAEELKEIEFVREKCGKNFENHCSRECNRFFTMSHGC